MIVAILRNSGFSPTRLLKSVKGWSRYHSERKKFKSMLVAPSMRWGREMPMLLEYEEAAGAPGAYFFQDLVVARWVLNAKPQRHIDVGSRIDGFIGNLSLFRTVEVTDIRPLPIEIPNVIFRQMDLMEPLQQEWISCTDSLSCLHSIEHFGLGRYGDTLDPQGHLTGLDRLKQMVAPGGRLYLSTPIGEERLEFNAHRVFSPQSLLSWFEEGWEIQFSALLDDELNLFEMQGSDPIKNAICRTGLGMICARKLA